MDSDKFNDKTCVVPAYDICVRVGLLCKIFSYPLPTFLILGILMPDAPRCFKARCVFAFIGFSVLQKRL